MPRKSARKIKPDGVADPLAAQDEDHQPLDAGEVRGGWLTQDDVVMMCFMIAPLDSCCIIWALIFLSLAC